jgi:hypothetical protein
MLIAETKDGRRINVARIGRPHAEHGSDEIFGYEIGCRDTDPFGNPVFNTIRIGDVSRFLGSFAFPPENFTRLVDPVYDKILMERDRDDYRRLTKDGLFHGTFEEYLERSKYACIGAS